MAITIQRTWSVAGLPTDVTTALISDPTGTFGIKRDDTGAVVVADGTAMTKVSTGNYEYTFNEPDSTITYTAYVEFVYQGSTYHFEHDIPASVGGDTALGTTFAKLADAVNDFLGWGSGETERTARAINAGYREFLHPIYTDSRGRKVSHEWSFLRPEYTFSTVADVSSYNLPADFGRLDGDLYYSTDDWSYHSIRQVSQQQVFNLQQYPWSGDSTYWPHYAAVQPIAMDGLTQQRWRLLLWPTPGQVYSIKFKYHALQNELDSSNPYPLGNAAHSLTIEAAVLYAAQRMYDDSIDHWSEIYKSRLEASVSMDRKMSPSTLGMIREESDGSMGVYYQTDVILVNGVEP
jgi:hypothetical protein